MNVVPSGLVPVHVGQPEPGSEQDHQLRARAAVDRERTGRRGRILQVPADLDWGKHDLQPRWLGMESSDCPVAIEPGVFHDQGADERRRFLAGAASRNETALLVSAIGDPDGDGIRNVFSSADASVDVGGVYTSVSGRRLPTGPQLELAQDLGKADRDLALRLRDRPPTAPWWALDLRGVTTLPGTGYGRPEVHEPKGRLDPILVNNLGEPVVAAWVSEDESQRWYILPAGIGWGAVLDWLMQQALPELNPAALRRSRSSRFHDPDLQTLDELATRKSLADLEERYADEKTELEHRLLMAREKAEPVRHGLLYEGGAPLVAVVRTVLSAAGLHVVDLDEELGATKSADLLVSLTGAGHPRQLVEIKGVGGPARESFVGDLQRHLDTWPQLRPDQPVVGGVLIVNHQHKLDPAERSREVYGRREFVDAMKVTVLSARQLFDWWRDEDWAAIRAAIFGDVASATSPATEAAPQPSSDGSSTASPLPVATGRRWRWRRSPSSRE